MTLSEKYAELIDVHKRLLSESLEQHYTVKNVVCSMRVWERYQWFLDKYPGLIDRIKHKDIAAFLGTTPVNLSRVRAKLKG